MLGIKLANNICLLGMKMNQINKINDIDKINLKVFNSEFNKRDSYEQKHSFFDECYFTNGKLSGKSLYENYRWLPELSYSLAKAICSFTKISFDDVVLDFGCARGYLVRALNEIGIKSFGLDVSKYAIANCDQSIKKKLFLIEDETLEDACKKLGTGKVDWIIAKDVFEHIKPNILYKKLCEASQLGTNMYVLVPLGDFGIYRISDYELDASHIIAENEKWWFDIFNSANFIVKEFHHKVNGIKESALPLHKNGNGHFILEPLKK